MAQNGIYSFLLPANYMNSLGIVIKEETKLVKRKLPQVLVYPVDPSCLKLKRPHVALPNSENLIFLRFEVFCFWK